MWNSNIGDSRLRHIRRDIGTGVDIANSGRDRNNTGIHHAGYSSARNPANSGWTGGMSDKRVNRGARMGGFGSGGDKPSGFSWSRYDDGNEPLNSARNATGPPARNGGYGEDRGGALHVPYSRMNQENPDDMDSVDQPSLNSQGGPTIGNLLNNAWSRRPRTFGRAAAMGIFVAFALAILSDRRRNLDYSYSRTPRLLLESLLDAASTIPGLSSIITKARGGGDGPSGGAGGSGGLSGPRPDFVYEHPYVSSSYYTSTKSIKTLWATDQLQVQPKLLVGRDSAAGEGEREIKTRLAIVRPFCEFDAEALPTTFACWNALPPCKAAQDDIGDDEDYEYELGPNGDFVAYKNNTAGRNLYEQFGDHQFFDQVGSDAMKAATADVFLFYSQTFSENDVAIKAVDTIIDQFFEPGGWSQCFDNIYAIEANIPQELDLYIPSAQEELYNWVNGPNRQFEAAFRIIQSGEWGDYDGFYLMEGDSVPIKAHWLDVVLSEIEVNRPFAILGAQYDGDKWDNFYEKIPISLLHHTNGNAIYNTSHPLLERLVGQLEVEAPCPYNSIPYDYRMSQMWVEGTLGIVPKLAPKIMLNEEGENITLSNNTEMFLKWADMWQEEDPFKYTPVIHNYAATNLIPRHLGPEYIIHGAKLYSPWDPTKTEVTLVVSEWFFDRSLHLIQHLDDKNHPFSEVVIMVPPAAATHDDYDLMTEVPVRTQHRGAPDFMDLCEADIKTDWFMLTNSYHHVARQVDLMFTPGTFKPVIPFTPATYAFCFKYPYCKETINLAQRFNPGHDKVVQDMDMLYNTEMRDAFCREWKEENGEEGEDLYKNQQRRLMFRKKIIGPPGPTGTSYYAFLVREGKDGMYKLTDRSLYGARPSFVKIFAKEEKLDGMSEDELAKRVGMTLLDNSTDCNCMAFETEADCDESGMGCIWRPLFESCHPPVLIDGSAPICPTTEAPTSAPTVPLDEIFEATDSPTTSPTDAAMEPDPWYVSMFKSRESELDRTNSANLGGAEDLTLLADDDDAILEPDISTSSRRVMKNDGRKNNNTAGSGGRRLEVGTHDMWYETDMNSHQRLHVADAKPSRKLQVDPVDSWHETDFNSKQLLETKHYGKVDISPASRKPLESRSLAPLNHTSPNIASRKVLFQLIAPLPTKQCDSWDPTIVPRRPTSSYAWEGASPDPESRSFSTAAISRPRRLHRSYLQYQVLLSRIPTSHSSLSQSGLDNLIETFSPYQDSWITSSVPINIPKYTFRQQDVGTGRIALALPEANDDSQLPSIHRTFVNYGETHPFEGAPLISGVTYRPLRITFIADHLLDFISNQNFQRNAERLGPMTTTTIARIEALTGDVLPSVSEIWAAALSVVQSTDNIFMAPNGGPNQGRCGESEIPPHHSVDGVPNTDTLIYVTANGPQCNSNKNGLSGAANIAAYAKVCSFDQHMRPISANLVVCLNDINASYDEVPEDEILRLTSSLTMEVGKILGLSPSLFQYFRNPENGKPWGTTEKKVKCIDGTEQMLHVPNVLEPSLELGEVNTNDGEPYFEMVTPTVQQTIRNHFDCQTLRGARLDTRGSSSCFGESFDPRFYFDEDLAFVGGSADTAFSLSPLTLAVLEDSSWYKADFSKSTVPLFGRGSGCGFAEGDCMTRNKGVPDYSRGFFCNDLFREEFLMSPKPSGCDYTHNHKADCETSSESGLFGENTLYPDGSIAASHCPMRTVNIVSCADKENTSALRGEVYSLNSRCFETNTPTSVCLESYCNSVDSKIDIVVDEKVFQCDYEGQEIDLGQGYSVKCPRLAIICPHLVCPANCSGKGICDYCQAVPQCVCDNPLDESPGCWGG